MTGPVETVPTATPAEGASPALAVGLVLGTEDATPLRFHVTIAEGQYCSSTTCSSPPAGFLVWAR